MKTIRRLLVIASLVSAASLPVVACADDQTAENAVAWVKSLPEKHKNGHNHIFGEMKRDKGAVVDLTIRWHWAELQDYVEYFLPPRTPPGALGAR